MTDEYFRVTDDPELESRLLDRLDHDLDTHSLAEYAVSIGLVPPGWSAGQVPPGIVTVWIDDADEGTLVWGSSPALVEPDQETAADILDGDEEASSGD
jgi:hypothetical protein